MSMGQSSAERQTGGIPLLEYAELLRPGQVDPVLNPDKIPIHPAVYESPSVYTHQFTTMVAMAVPGSIRRDIEAMKRVLNTDFNLEVDEESIYIKGVDSDLKNLFKSFDLDTYPDKHRLDLMYGSSNIAVVPPERGRIPFTFRPFSFNPHPIPLEKLIAYGYDPDDGRKDLISWYAHNLPRFHIPIRMYFRNFAIMFNNLGLQEINK